MNAKTIARQLAARGEPALARSLAKAASWEPHQSDFGDGFILKLPKGSALNPYVHVSEGPQGYRAAFISGGPAVARGWKRGATAQEAIDLMLKELTGIVAAIKRAKAP